MKDTFSNRMLLNRLASLCEDTPWELNTHEREGYIFPVLFTRNDAPEYTPDFRLADETCFSGAFRVAVQTTSYGALAPDAIMQVAEGLMAGAQLAKAMSLAIQLARYRVLSE